MSKNNGTPAIFGTIKLLSEEQKQIINNYVRDEYSKANVAIWAVKADEREHDELNSRIIAANESGDWSSFKSAAAAGQVVPSARPGVESDTETETEKVRVASENRTESELIEGSLGFGQAVERLLSEEVDRRLAGMRRKIRVELIEELRGLSVREGER